MSRKFVLRENSKLIIAPKLLSWFMIDFGDPSILNILDFFAHK